jgi:hypothetical protein
VDVEVLRDAPADAGALFAEAGPAVALLGDGAAEAPRRRRWCPR